MQIQNFDPENCLLDYFEIYWNNTIEVEKDDVNHSLANFMGKINGLVDKYIPLKQFIQKFNPWICNKILKKIQQKNKIFKRFVKIKNGDQISLLKDQLKQLKN